MLARLNGHRVREVRTATGALNGKTGHRDTLAVKGLMAAVAPAAGAGPTAVNEVTTDVRPNVTGQRHRLCPKLPLPLFRTTKAWIPLPARFA